MYIFFLFTSLYKTYERDLWRFSSDAINDKIPISKRIFRLFSIVFINDWFDQYCRLKLFCYSYYVFQRARNSYFQESNLLFPLPIFNIPRPSVPVFIFRNYLSTILIYTFVHSSRAKKNILHIILIICVNLTMSWIQISFLQDYFDILTAENLFSDDRCDHSSRDSNLLNHCLSNSFNINIP